MWLASGMVIFTKLVYFKTPTGETRLLTYIEAVYLCTQIVTTVGYGDLTPASPAAQVFVATFILLGAVFVGVVFTEALKVFMRGGERAIIKAIHKDTDSECEDAVKSAAMSTSTGTDLLESEIARNMARDDEAEQRKVLMEFLLSMAPFVGSLIVGTLFFVWYPGEDKSIWEAFYMSCVTLTSVGFGAVTPATQGGMLFAAVWMIMGVGATAHMIICFSNYFLKRHREIQIGQLQVELLAEMDVDGNNAVDKCEFLRFELIRCGLCQKDDIDAILARFQMLDVDHSGAIDIEDLKRIKRVTESQLTTPFASRKTIQRSPTGSS